MSLSSTELWQRITAAGLASPMQCRAWAADATTGLSASESTNVDILAASLVRLGKLTQFQADTILSGSDQPLTRFGWRILEPVALPELPAHHGRKLWHDWWVAIKTGLPTPRWVRWLERDDLRAATISEAYPSLPQLLKHSQVNATLLQPVDAPEMSGGRLQLVLQPVEGTLVTALCDGQPQSLDVVRQLVLDVGSALAALHAAGLTHGRVTPDRISLGPDNRFRLLRDPLCSATLTPEQTNDQKGPMGLLRRQLPAKMIAAHFLAPEFLSPLQAATQASDCYSLGVLAWTLLTGRLPFKGRETQEILIAHAEGALDLNRVSHVPEPIVRCLVHCLAKNPSARFASAAELTSAFETAFRIVASGKTQPSPKSEPATTQTAPAGASASGKPTTTAAVKSKTAAITAATSAVTTAPSAAAPPSTAENATAEKATASPARSTANAPAPVKVAKTNEPASQPRSAPKAQPAVAQGPPTESVGKVKPATKTASPASDVSSAELLGINAQTPATAATAVSDLGSRSPTDMHSESVGPDSSGPKSSGPESGQSESAVAAPQSIDAQRPASQSASVGAAAGTAGQVARPGEVPARTAGPRAAPAKSVGVRRGVRKSPVKRKPKNAWLTPVIGGGALVVLLLLLVLFNGGLGGGASGGSAKKPTESSTGSKPTGSDATSTSTTAAQAAVTDPRAELFELVENNQQLLWAPPRAPASLTLDLLPPGGQLFIALRPQRMLGNLESKAMINLFEPELAALWKWLAEQSGIDAPQIAQVVIAAYPGTSGVPQYALRVELASPQSLTALKSAWKNPSETKVDAQSLWVSGPRAYYVPSAAGADTNTSSFGVGPLELMRDVATAQGAAGPLPAAMEKLLQASDGQNEVNLLLVPSFLFTEGREILATSPPRINDIATTWLSREMRAAGITLGMQGDWFYELRLIGTSDRDAATNQQRLREALRSLPQDVEEWFVNAVPHPHWRALALRYPNMLRALSTQTRVGVEAGQAIANGYLPAIAVQNLMYASWMAVQPAATNALTVAGGASTTTAQPPLTPEQILDRVITLTVDQQGIEVVLQLISEQANEKLPPGTKPLKFELDGSGFQRAGFTRNQQVKDFKIIDQSVRQALTELARRQNPVPGVQDPKSAEQKMLWVLTNADKPGEAMVSLTSRDAATTAGLALPKEFAP